jgi:putative PEP-CTERM system histidine kinase
MTIAQWSHAVCAMAYAVLAAVLLSERPRHAVRSALAIAALAVAAWSAAIAWAADLVPGTRGVAALEMLRACGLVGFLLLLLRRELPDQRWGRGFQAFGAAILVAWILAILAGAGGMAALASLAATIFGAACVENIARNAAPERRWSMKFGALGFLAIFAYDFALHVTWILRTGLEAQLWVARGAVDALAMPLILATAARDPLWRLGLHVSRDVVFHSTIVVFAGLVLVASALAGTYLGAGGGSLGAFLQILAVAAASLGATIVAMSGWARSRLRNFIARHFFTYRYDWRREWLRFIARLATEDGAETLATRGIKAIADIADSPGGAVWIADGAPGALSLAAAWNIAVPDGARAAAVVDAHDLLVRTDPLDGVQASALLAAPAAELATTLAHAWLVLPLAHRGVRGFIALAAPRAPRELGWEDYALLTTAVRQVASYLAEDAAARQLATARQIDGFNRRFAFVVHDVKTMASQIQLLLRNADRHAGEAAFTVDLFATLRGLAARLEGLIADLREGGVAASPNPGSAGVVAARRVVVDLDATLDALVAAWPAERVVRRGGRCNLRALGDPRGLSTALGHLVQNAVEATEGDAPVEIGIEARGDHVAIVVADRGRGMDPTFLRDDLFEPFRSTKPTGSGLGAFQARALLAEMGAGLSVDSHPGQGTTAIVSLPCAEAR